MRSRLDVFRAGLSGAQLRVFVAAIVSVHLAAAWFNGGFLHPDEHYQIIEFAQYKLGRQPASALAWEFDAQIRPAVQPWLAAGVIRLCLALGLSSPFLAAFSLRLLSTFLALWVSFELCTRCLGAVERPALKVAALGASFMFWITPTAHGRFSSENWGGALLVGGVCLMLDLAEAWPTRRRKALVLALCTGLVWSVAFYCRFQVGVAIAGAGLWLVCIRRVPLRLLLAVVVSFVIGCGLNEVVNHWLYGVWTFAPYNYVLVNLVQGKAAEFGVSPWWMLGVYMTVVLIPPYSLAILALGAVGCWYARRHVLVWLTLPLVLVHAVVAHKEPRFLIPILYVIGPLFAVCLEALPSRLRAPLFAWLRTRAGRAHVSLWCALNVLILFVVMLAPANVSYPIERWLWAQGRNGPMTVFTAGESPFRLSGSTTNSFYRSEHIALTPLRASDQLRGALADGPVFVYYTGDGVPQVVAAVGACVPVQRSLPPWVRWLPQVKWIVDADQSTICRIDRRP